MNILQITPGAGGMYCGGCFRDNALVAAWRKLGHEATMLPLYLPMTLDEEDQSGGSPIFFGGINVYLQQKSGLFGKLPGWIHRLLASPALLKRAAGSAASTRAEDVGDLTISMLRGDHGHQRRELDELAHWLKHHLKPDVICLSNALLMGMTARLKRELNVPIYCLLAGEDSFLDGLPERHRAMAWQAARDAARDVDGFAASSRYYAEVMTGRLQLPAARVEVVYPGINLEGYRPAATPPSPPVLGYFARMCEVKGLPALVDAFIELKKRNRILGLRLRVGGGLSPIDEAKLVNGLKAKLRSEGLGDDVEFCPNLSRDQKLDFYRSLSVLSVPALYGEAFGLYVIEAWASGVPVVQPRHAAFPELVNGFGAGVIYEPDSTTALADAIEQLLLNGAQMNQLRQTAREAALKDFSMEQMAQRMVTMFKTTTAGGAASARAACCAS